MRYGRGYSYPGRKHGNPHKVLKFLYRQTQGADWGSTIFLGRNVYVGINGASSSLGTGPYWVY
ncbi:DUF3443 family protein [bacterium]|nr:MAG: DUF3443 family protein [bacterium]